ncbi:hypothetical protein chiPu_0019720 [Chiloscyllium punctatum]|uniref:Uncharacterized protein n=1 Tax=Chiloscyllium punctatum TaxID=137246 RepID=A0A401RSY3_CHIPU|nr:hypothetical protein [Chiloscyllium punctatum]
MQASGGLCAGAVPPSVRSDGDHTERTRRSFALPQARKSWETETKHLTDSLNPVREMTVNVSKLLRIRNKAD